MKYCTGLNKETGSSVVEFAIILPILLLFVFGIIEWSLYLFNSHIITNAGRAGARTGIVQAVPRVSEDAISTAVLSYVDGNLVTFGAEAPPSISITAICAERGDDLGVTVIYDYTFLLLPALTFGGVPETLTITADTVMKCE
jgi:hypothetical protein